MSQNLQNFAEFQKFHLDNLVDFFKCCETRIYLQKSVPIQPKTSNISPKICQKFGKCASMPHPSAAWMRAAWSVAAGSAAMTESGRPRPAKRSHAAGRKVDRFQRDKRDPSVIVCSEIKRCQLPQSTKFFQKAKKVWQRARIAGHPGGGRGGPRRSWGRRSRSPPKASGIGGPGGSVHGERANFTRLVLGWLAGKPDYRSRLYRSQILQVNTRLNSYLVRKLLTRSTRFTRFCTFGIQ